MLALALALLGSLHGGAAVPLAEPGQDVAVEAIPPVRDRADAGSGTLQIAGLRVEGVGEHPQAGIAPATMQALAERLQAFLDEHFYECTPAILRSLADMCDGGGSVTENLDALGGPGTARLIAGALRCHAAD